jgi:hypothetical protein
MTNAEYVRARYMKFLRKRLGRRGQDKRALEDERLYVHPLPDLVPSRVHVSTEKESPTGWDPYDRRGPAPRVSLR